MRKVFLTVACALFVLPAFSYAAGDEPDDILSIVNNIKPSETDQHVVTHMLGKPDKTEANRKQSVWYYRSDKNDIKIYWNNRTATVEKCYVTALSGLSKDPLDNTKANRLKSGETSLAQAIKILGAPRDMKIKSVNQELHYSYQNAALNLFFHNGTLVSYTLF